MSSKTISAPSFRGKAKIFLSKNAVLCVAICFAIVTAFLVPPDKEYIGYFDFKTLTCLFCVLAVVCALKNIRFFRILAEKITALCGNLRSCVITLLCITFVGSMLIANDMALLTFLPLGYYVLSSTGKEKYMAHVFILQNISANLGGMLTPFGNPQNLYLYSRFDIPTGEFMGNMLLPFMVSIALIFACCLIFPREKLVIADKTEGLPPIRTAIYLLLFAFSILIVFRFIPYWWGLIVIPIAILIMDRKALRKVDYGLLFTFVFFFIFAGNMARIPAVADFIGGILNRNVLVVSALSCQCISNVPSAILLSRFTENYADLLRGVNIGGCGTIISSLASLITYREYTSRNPGKAKQYLVLFSVYNFAFLFILLLVCSI